MSRAFKIFVVLAAGAVLMAVAMPAGAQTVVTNSSAREIKLEYSFAGSSVVIFGAVDHVGPNPAAKPIGIIIRLEGPKQPVIVRKKEHVAGLWINRQSHMLTGLPGYLAVQSSQGIDGMPGPDEMAQSRLLQEAAAVMPDVPKDFVTALYRLKTDEALFSAREGAVTILANTLFSGEFTLPANTPVGNYVAEVLLVEDGAVVATQSTEIAVHKAGLELRVANLAHRQPLTYGLIAVTLALLAGWLAGLFPLRKSR